jgi:hypothetical protein
MYGSNGFARRRPEGWAERRRYFKRLLAQARPRLDERPKDKVSGSAK